MSKAKNLIGFVWLKTEIIHGREKVLLPRNDNRTIIKKNSAFLMEGRSRSNSVEEITSSFFVPQFAIFINL